MKHFSLSFYALAFVSALCLWTPDTMAWVKVSPSRSEQERQPVKRVLSPEFRISQALEAHALLNQTENTKQAQTDYNESKKQYEDAQKRFQALNDCNIKRLSEQFKDPKSTWEKITRTYDEKEKELSIYINAAEPTHVYQVKQSDDAMYSDQEISEMFLHWSLGNEILTDVYANQDAWGERKNKEAPSFPLWEDQKFFFDKEWDDYYTELNTLFGVPPQGRPIIDDRKYDYNQAEQTQKAHDAYMKLLMAKNPQRMAIMPEHLKKGPKIAPRPLPPVEEIVKYIGDIETSHQIFPAWPEPWQKQIENNFANYNSKGELAKDFIPKTFKLRKQFGQYEPYKQENRLNVYQLEKKKLDGAKKIMEAREIALKTSQETLQRGLDKLKIDASASADLTTDRGYESVAGAIKKKKEETLQTIEKQLTDAPIHKDIQTMVTALRKDESGQTYISASNAAYIDQALRESAAQKELLAEQKQHAQEQIRLTERSFNDKCLLADN